MRRKPVWIDGAGDPLLTHRIHQRLPHVAGWAGTARVAHRLRPRLFRLPPAQRQPDVTDTAGTTGYMVFRAVRYEPGFEGLSQNLLAPQGPLRIPAVTAGAR